MSQVILKGIIALFLIGFLVLSFSPIISQLAEDEGMWGGVTDSRAVFLRDNAVTLFYVAGMIGFITTVMWMFNASQSKGASSIYG